MLFHEVPLPDEARRWRELVLVPLADLHIGDPRFDEQLFIKTRDWILDEPNRFVILSGDVLNMALKNSKSSVYEETMRPRDAIRYAEKLLEPLQDRVWSAVPGNHEERMVREVDVDPTEVIAGHLGCRYDPVAVCLKVRFGAGENGDPVAYIIHHTHGASNARRPGGKLNHMEDLGSAWEGVDVFISGHSHARLVYRETKYVADPRNNVLRTREVVYVNTSTFLAWGGYAERRGYKPAALGPPRLVFSGREKRVEVVA